MPEEVKKFKSKASGTIFDTFEEAKADEAKYSALSDKKKLLIGRVVLSNWNGSDNKYDIFNLGRITDIVIKENDEADDFSYTLQIVATKFVDDEAPLYRNEELKFNNTTEVAYSGVANTIDELMKMLKVFIKDRRLNDFRLIEGAAIDKFVSILNRLRGLEEFIRGQLLDHDKNINNN